VQALKREELAKFLEACREQSEQTWLMALLAVNHGLRVGELCGRWAVRKLKGKKEKYFHHGILAREVRNGLITVRRLKGSEITKQPLVSNENPLFDERAAVEKLVLKTNRNQPLFKLNRTTAWRHLQAAGRAAGVKLSAAHIRGMKHTLGTLAAENTAPKELQTQMGHKDGKNTLRYYDTTPEQAAEAVKRALAL